MLVKFFSIPSRRLAFVYNLNENEMDQTVRNDITCTCYCVPNHGIALNFDAFLDDFNCVFTQIRCLSVLLH